MVARFFTRLDYDGYELPPKSFVEGQRLYGNESGCNDAVLLMKTVVTYEGTTDPRAGRPVAGPPSSSGSGSV